MVSCRPCSDAGWSAPPTSINTCATISWPSETQAMLLGRMILRRMLWVFPVAFGVVTLTFFMARVFNGDPTELYVPPEATDALRAQIRARLGLADPLPVQYLNYLWDLLRLD